VAGGIRTGAAFSYLTHFSLQRGGLILLSLSSLKTRTWSPRMCSGLASWHASDGDTGAVFPPTHPCGWQGPGTSEGGRRVAQSAPRPHLPAGWVTMAWRQSQRLAEAGPSLGFPGFIGYHYVHGSVPGPRPWLPVIFPVRKPRWRTWACILVILVKSPHCGPDCLSLPLLHSSVTLGFTVSSSLRTSVFSSVE